MFFQAYKNLADVTNDAQNFLDSYQKSQNTNNNPMANAQYYNEKVHVAKEQLRTKQKEIVDLKYSKKQEMTKIMEKLKEVQGENKYLTTQIDLETSQMVSTKQKLDEIQNDIEDLRLEKALISKRNNKDILELELKLEQDKYILKALSS